MATLIEWNGQETEVRPTIPERGFTRDELSTLLEGAPVEYLSLADGRLMVIIEQMGTLRTQRGLVNVKATLIFQQGRGTGLAILGSVIIGCPGEIL